MLEEREKEEAAQAIDPPSTDGGGNASLEAAEGEANLIDPPSTDGGGS